jgi:hypothetical protein
MPSIAARNANAIAAGTSGNVIDKQGEQQGIRARIRIT